MNDDIAAIETAAAGHIGSPEQCPIGETQRRRIGPRSDAFPRAVSQAGRRISYRLLISLAGNRVPCAESYPASTT